MLVPWSSWSLELVGIDDLEIFELDLILDCPLFHFLRTLDRSGELIVLVPSISLLELFLLGDLFQLLFILSCLLEDVSLEFGEFVI